MHTHKYYASIPKLPRLGTGWLQVHVQTPSNQPLPKLDWMLRPRCCSSDVVHLPQAWPHCNRDERCRELLRGSVSSWEVIGLFSLVRRWVLVSWEAHGSLIGVDDELIPPHILSSLTMEPLLLACSVLTSASALLTLLPHDAYACELSPSELWAEQTFLWDSQPQVFHYDNMRQKYSEQNFRFHSRSQ